MPPESPSLDFAAILEVLSRHDVKFIVVGGVAAALHGSPSSTFDLDIVHARDDANVRRLLGALEELDAVYRMQPERRLRPNLSHLSARGHNLLPTKFGALDILGTIGRANSYDELSTHVNEFRLTEHLTIAVMDLTTQIAVKREVNGPKDRAQIPILEELLAAEQKK